MGLAWVGLCLALAVHVTDEALNDFLSIYNPVAQSIRDAVPWAPVPVFDFNTWLTALVGVVVALLALSPFVFRGARPLRGMAYAFSILMLLNALAHSVGSLVLGRAMPGAYSSPLLLVAGLFLLQSLLQSRPPLGKSGDLPARIRAEHERVTKVAQEIRAIIGAATPDERTPQWRLALLQLLRDLANELVEHFQLEEEGGFMSEVLSRLPQKARIVQGLEREHAEITRRLDKVVIDVEAVRQGNDSDVLDIRRQTTAVLSLLDDHEAAESALIQEAYLQDEGGPD